MNSNEAISILRNASVTWQGLVEAKRANLAAAEAEFSQFLAKMKQTAGV